MAYPKESIPTKQATYPQKIYTYSILFIILKCDKML